MLGVGLLVLIVGLGAMALVLAYRGAPHRVAARSRVAAPSTSRAVEAATSAGLPPPAVVGVRFALDPGRGRTAVPVRSALLGAVLAVALVVATLTFGSGLQALVSHPALYGWNFSYLLNASNTTPPQALSLLDHDPDVVAWDGYDYNDAEIDGQGVPFLFESGHSATKAPISPPILAGHAVEAKDQIVLGAATLAQLDKQIGDTVVVTLRHARESRLRRANTSRRGGHGHDASRWVLQRHRRSHLHGDGGADVGRRVAPSFEQALSSSNPDAQRAESRFRAVARTASRPPEVSPTCNASPQRRTTSSPPFPTVPGRGTPSSVSASSVPLRSWPTGPSVSPRRYSRRLSPSARLLPSASPWARRCGDADATWRC